MAELIQLKRLKDLKIVGSSTTNGNIKLDGVETTVYTHPTTHNADMIVDGTTNKAYTSVEKTKLSTIASGSTKVESSVANGNIKIDGVESNVYSQPNQKLNRSDSAIIVNKSNMNDIIYVYTYYNVIFTDEVRNIDEGFSYTLINNSNTSTLDIVDENGQVIPELDYKFPYCNYTKYEITKIDGIYKVTRLSDNNYTTLDNIPPLIGISSLNNGINDILIMNGGSNYSNYNVNCTLSTVLGESNKASSQYQLIIGSYNKGSTEANNNTAFEIGNGEYSSNGTGYSNAFEVYKNGLVGIFGDIKIKGGTILNTVSQTVQGAINELKESISSHLSDNISHITSTERTNWNKSVPYITNTISMTVEVSDIVKSVTISHSLGYIPKTLVYVESIENSKTFLTQLPIIYSSGNGISVKVSNNSIVITYDRTNGVPLSVPLTYTFRYRIYKEEL